MYADYTYYQTEYGGKMSADDFKRFGRKAERRIDSLTGNKLQFAFPANERHIEAVKDCLCELADFLYQIDLYNAAAMESIGTVAQADGTVKGKVITSISSGSESRSYSASGTANTSVTEAAKDKKVADTVIYGMVQDDLGGVPDYNGINLLYAGVYPYSTKVVNPPPEDKPTPTEPPETEIEPPTDTGDTGETEQPDSGEDNTESEDIYFTDSVVVYNKYVNGLREETQYFGTRFDGVRIEFTQEENQNKAGKEDTSVCLLKIKNDSTLPKPFLDPKSWEHLTTDEMLKYFTLDVDGDFFVIVKRKGLNLDVQAPVGVQDSNNAKYGGNFFEYMKQNYGYVYSMNSFEQFDGIPYFQVGGI